MKSVKAKFTICNDERHLRLMRWARKSGIRHAKLVPASFAATGRGLLTSRNIECNSVVIAIPENMLLSFSTIKKCFVGKLLDCNTIGLSFTDTLCLYILSEKHKGEKSTWVNYFRVLPCEFSTLSYLPEETIDLLPIGLGRLVESQNRKIQTCFRKICLTLRHVKEGLCANCEILLKDLENMHLSLHNIKWAWNVVNTRCVYMKTADTLVKSAGQSMNFVLAPVLDLLNHSSTANVTAQFNEVSRCYEIITHKAYKRGEQVFINYGFHNNRTLLQEYGFYLEDNIASEIPVSVSYLWSIISQECTTKQLIQKRKLLQKLNIDWNRVGFNHENINWALEKVLRIASMQGQSWQEVEKLLDDNPLMSEYEAQTYKSLVERVLQNFVLKNEMAISKLSLFMFKKANAALCTLDSLLRYESRIANALHERILGNL